INSLDGDHVYLYFGAGRGGRYYYGVDATRYNSPRKLWNAPIQGGLGGLDMNMSGPVDEFAELGYTMAEPVRGRVRIDGTDHDVLVLSGGYDPDYESLPDEVGFVDSGEDMGRAIYLVDARTGEKLWTGAGAGVKDAAFDD